jgi:outer membrane protein assembly factor BamB
MALPLDATSDITDSGQIVWSKTRGTPYVPSPILYDGLLYFNQSNDAILTCLDAKTGETLIERTRMLGLRGLYASPVGASGRVYVVGRNGVTLVLEKGSEFKVLATNTLEEPIDATPALVGNQIFLRGEKSVYCISEG